MPQQLSKTRADLTIHGSTVTKRYRSPADALNEIGWYQTLPTGICPNLIDADPTNGVLVIAYHHPANELQGYRPVKALAELLEELETRGVHHRDVHPGNIVDGPHGPLLIDWETAVSAAGLSYDLHGPAVTGIPIPSIHQALGTGYAMWWGSDHRMSIKNAWRAECIPTISDATVTRDYPR